MKHEIPYIALKTLYYSLFHSHITYGISVWGSSEFIKKITILQKKIIRIIHNKPFRSHTDMLFKLSEILKVTNIYKLQCALFVHDYMHNKLPISFNDSFTKTANPNSRQSSNLFKHRPRTKFSSRLPKHKFSVIWNSLSHDHHSITSRNIFKKTLKRSFLDNYTPVDHPC